VFGLRRQRLVLVLLSVCWVFGQAPRAKKPAVSVWSQEPDGFRGLPFGSSRASAGSSIKHCFTHEGKVLCAAHKDEEWIGPVSVNIGYTFIGDGLVKAFGIFESHDFEALRDIFVERYGQPHHDNTAAKNFFGNVVLNRTLNWEGKRALVTLIKYSPSDMTGSFDVSLNRTEQAKREESAKRKAADSL
jgi:hypothetical protein